MTKAPTPAAPITNSIWHDKPWWCQPWSIVLTGVAVVVLSWLWLQRWWFSCLAASGVLAWWLVFLVLVPRGWKAASQAEENLP